MFNFQHPQQCGEHPHQEMASYGPVAMADPNLPGGDISSALKSELNKTLWHGASVVEFVMSR